MLDRRQSPRDKIAQKGRSFLAKTISWRDNFLCLAFGGEPSSNVPHSDLEERLRQSEQKKRQLQRQIDKLIGDRE